MRFMVMHKHDKSTEAGVRPSMEFIQEMGGLVGEFIQNGVFKDGAGLGKTASRTRVTFKKGERHVVDGPFSKGTDNELIHSFFQLTTKNRAEAVEWASKLGRILGDCELEVGKTTEEWDLGLSPEPPNAPHHYLVLQKATPATEKGQAPSAAVSSAIEALKKESTAAGVLTSSAVLAPSARGVRVQMDRNNKRHVVDGPFTESKEMIGGFAVLEMPSKEAVVEFAWRYGALMLKSVETLELDIRLVAE